MSHSIPQSISDSVTELNSEYLSVLIKENESLKELNMKLYRKHINQKRKIVRLKKIITDLNSSKNNSQTNTDALSELSKIDIDDNWEDVNDVLESYSLQEIDRNTILE